MKKTVHALFLCFLFAAPLSGCVQDRANTKAQVEAKMKLGSALLAEGNAQAALKTLLEAEAMDPENEVLENAVGLTYMRFEQGEKAARHFRKALEIKPDFSDAMNNLGTVYAREGKVDQAIELFAKASEDLMYSSRYYAFNNLGTLYLTRGRYDKALQSYQKAVEVLPGYSDAYRNMGIAYEGLQQWQNAVDAYKRAIQSDPEYPLSYLQLANLYIRLHRSAEAREMILKAMSLDKSGQFKKEAQRLLEESEKRG